MKQFSSRVAALVAKHVQRPAAELEPLFTAAKNPAHGDVALPCFKLAQLLGRAGKDAAPALAAELAAALQAAGDPLVQTAEAVGPFVNVRLEPTLVAREVVTQAWTKPRWGSSDEGAGKTIVIDFSSPNIAKPFHLGHLRSTVIGWSLRQIFRALGYRVVGVNHLGDWGTQFGLMIAAWKRWRDEAEERLAKGERDVDLFFDLYVRINKLKKEDPRVADEGRAWFKKLEDGDAEALELWHFFVDRSKAEFARIYELLGITHESDAGEAFYNDKMPETVRVLERTGLLVDGKSKLEQLADARQKLEAARAKVAQLEVELAAASDEKKKKEKAKELDKERARVADHAKKVKKLEVATPADEDEDDSEAGPAELRPRGVLVDLGGKDGPFFSILLKADGGTTYTTRDLTAVRYRAETYHPAQILYVVGNTQRDHFVPWFKIVEQLAARGETWAQGLRLEHIGFGNYLGMSTRGGTAVFLEEVLNRANVAANAAAESAEKKVSLSAEERARVARAIGTGAVKFFDLKGSRTNDIDLSVPGRPGEIDWERLLNLKGDSGPYLQFAHARLAGILRRVPEAISADVDFCLLTDPEAQALIKAIAEFPEKIAQAAADHEPSVISRYLLDLSTRIHSFLHERRVLDGQVEGAAPEDVRRARVLLVAVAKKVLAEALDLLGIEAVEQM